jgi:hypothetical protein
MNSFKTLLLAVPFLPLSGRQVAAAPIPAPAEPQPGMLEFHAEAGALEGALYLDGELVGYLPGIRRL